MLYLHFNYFTFTPQGSSIITKPLPDLFFHPLALPWAKDVLARHGEHPFSHLHHPLLLVIPQRGFTHLTQTYPSARWWIQRVHRLHRDVLDLGVDLSSEWEGEVSRMQELAAWVPARWHAWMYVEHAMMRMMGGGGGGGEGGGGNLSSSSSSSVMERGLQEAGKACHFSWTFIGRLGKRTHFQTQSHAQLTVTTQRQGPVEPSSVLGAPMIPTTTVEAWPPLCLVNDETVLDQVRWDDPPTEEGSLPCKGSDALSFLEQCILLGYCRLNALTHPYDDLLAKEEQGALLQSILDPSHWHPTIRHVAVYYRSLLDLHRPRYRDRGLLQLERLTEPPFLDSPASQQGRGGAPLYFFATPMVPQWTHLLTLAHTWMRAGAYGSAVKVFERFEQWDLVIQCYLGSRLREKAEAVVHALMAQERSAQGVYWLGELKNDPKFFEEAWVLGKQKWAKPKRALGTYYFHQGNFELSLHHWKEALQLNPMHTQGWFMSGCAALRLQAWSIAAEHFSRCTSLDPEQGLAWSNLSTALLQMDQRKPAWHALHQAVKQVRNDWKVWSNLLGVSLSLKYWEDAVLAMDHIFQLAPTQLQVQDMQALVAILPTSVSSYQRDRLLWLATKLQDASSVHPSTFAWQAVLLHLYVHLNAPTSILQGCEAMVRGWQRLTHVDPSFLPDLVASCRSVWHCYKTYGPSRDEHTGLQRCSDWAYQAKLGVSGVVAKLKSDYESTPEYVQLCQLLEEIQTTLDMQPEE
ncbi:hypothetical protein HMI56_006407 [Coelomomyces lativittatus]|nr:hypothetical protein HMI56_006407 [Coelomomyces lativittatus]